MTITLNTDYDVTLSTALLGYVGETNARPVSVEGMEIDGADRYVLTIDYGDGVQYEVDITGGQWTPTADILRSAQTVSCQICAKKLSGQEYILLKKSRIFRLRIGAAIGDNAVPSPDVAIDALDRIDAIGRQAHADMQTAVTAAETATTSAENAEKSATAAGLSADTATQAASRAETAKTAAETSATQAETAMQGAETARAEAVTAQNAAKVSADQASASAQQTTADKNITSGYAKTAKTCADSTTADRQAVQTLAEQVTADKAIVADHATQVAEDRTAAETAAQTAQAVADSLPEDYTTAVGKIAENTTEINNTNSNVSQLKGDLTELYNHKRKTFFLSDIDNTSDSYYFLEFPMKQGKEYTVKSSKDIGGCYARAEKYVKPSLQTIGYVGQIPKKFIAVEDMNWLALYTELTETESFTFEINDETRIVSQHTAELSQHTAELSQHTAELSQFTNPVGSDFNVDDFIIGGRGSYGTDPTSSETRVTNKITGMSFLVNMTITPKDNSVKHYIYRQQDDSTGWITTPFTMESGKKYDYVCAYADDRTITDIAELLSHFTIISDLTSKVLEIDETIEFVKKISSEYKDKTISILGDSISTFGGDGGDNRTSDGTWTYLGNRCRYPQSNLLIDVNDTYWKRIIDTLGLRLGINESWAGSRVSNTASTDSGDVGPNRHIASATRIGHLGENGTPDIILVNAGTNDIGASVTVGTFNTENPMNYTDEEIASLPVATFADAYRTMLIRLQKMYPTAKIICLLPNYTTSYYTPTQADVYCEVIKEACDFFGIKWKDMRASGITMFNRGTYLPDGIHYNSNGMEMIAKNILKELRYDFTM